MKIKQALIGAGFAGLTALSMGGCVPYSTGTNEIGVRYCKFWCLGNKVEIVPQSQTVFLLPIKNDWYSLDMSMQTFYMTADKNTGDRQRQDDLEFKTKEGNNIGQDVTLTWKLDPSKAQHIIEEVGISINDIKEKYVRPLARSIVRDFLNELTSPEFYEGQRRFEEASKATEELKKRFAPYGILIDQVNMQDYRFEDTNYQTAINDAKNAGQDKEKYEREIASERENWAKQFQAQVGASNQMIAEAEGYKNQKTLDGDAYFVQSENSARATLKEKLNQAEGMIKLRKAMASQGGDTAVLMEYVKGFKPTEVVILPCDESGNGVSIKRIDVNQLLGGEAAK